MKTAPFIAHAAVLVMLGASISMSAVTETSEYALEVLPAEHSRTTDPETGAELLYITTDPARDWNLYFYHRSWLADNSLILFRSERERGGLMGYLVETGELARLHTPEGGVTGATAAKGRNSVFVRRGVEILELALEINISADPESTRSEVHVEERVLCRIPEHESATAVNENSDETMLSIGLTGVEGVDGPVIYTIDVASGKLSELCRLPDPPGYGGHVQWSRTNPYLLSFPGRPSPDSDFSGPRRENEGPTDFENRRERLWVVDVRDGVPRNVYRTLEGELVTHESWWVDDQILFCGGTRSEPPVEQHVKVLDIYTGHVRVIGAGAWWPDGEPEELARYSWWHAAGSEDGRWVVADNFHGDIKLFEGATTRPHMLTRGHRTYGQGIHAHPGWDNKGEQVIFASDKRGEQNVCVATIPPELQEQVKDNTSGLSETAPGE